MKIKTYLEKPKPLVIHDCVKYPGIPKQLCEQCEDERRGVEDPAAILYN